MGRLNFYETETNYNSAKDNFDYPTVAYVEESEEVKWMLKPPHDYSKDYLTFEALEDGTFTLNIPANVDSTYMTSVSYSTDDGENWTTTTVDNTAQTITTPMINQGGTVLWKGIGKQLTKTYTSDNYSYFSSTGNFNVSGNTMSLFYNDNFVGQTEFDNSSEYNLAYLFRNATKLINAKNLILPATILTDCCYSSMFGGCTSLMTGPKLPATTLAQGCYAAINPYVGGMGMFQNCTSLTTPPELPATTLATGCYAYMFNGCTSLTSAPVLPATTLVSNCYQNMFANCTNLNYIKAMFTTSPTSSFTIDWVSGVAASGTFVKNSAANWNVTGVNGVPTGWTVETASE